MLVRVGLMHLAHGSVLAAVDVPGNTFNVPIDVRILQFACRPSPEVPVVIEDPDLGGKLILLQRWPKMFAHELNLMLLGPEAGRHSSVLVGIHFVLGCHRVDYHAF